MYSTYSMDDILVYAIPKDSYLLILHFYMGLATLHRIYAKYRKMFPSAENKSRLH